MPKSVGGNKISSPQKSTTKVASVFVRQTDVKIPKPQPKRNAVVIKKVVSKDDAKITNVAIIDNIQKGIGFKQSKRNQKKSATKRAVSKAIPIKETRQTIGSKIPLVRDTLRVSIPSPFRFPIDSARLAAQTARYFGVFFVIAGAVLTYLNIQFINQDTLAFNQTQYAAVLSPSYNCDDPNSPNYNQIYCDQQPVNTTPEANIEVNSSGGTSLFGDVPVTVTVPDATGVVVYALDLDTQYPHVVGSATKVSENIWKVTWATSQYDESTYSLKAAITNNYGTYTQFLQTSYNIFHTDPTIQNDDADEISDQSVGTATTTNATGNGTTASSTDIISVVPSPLPISVVVNSGLTLQGSITFDTIVANASAVKHYLLLPDGTQKFLGYATAKDSSKWQFKFDSTKFDDGKYKLTTKVAFLNGSVGSKSLIVTVQNTDQIVISDDIPDEAVSEVTFTTPLIPTITLYLPEGSTLAAGADVYVHVEAAYFVELYVIPEQSLTRKFIGRPQKIDDSSWRFNWDTRNTPNGSYQLVAMVRHTYGDSFSDPVTVTISNSLNTTPTLEQQEYLQKLGDVHLEQLPEGEQAEPTFEEVVNTEISRMFEDNDSDTRTRVLGRIEYFNNRIKEMLEKYATAYRNDDEETITHILDEVAALRKTIVDELPISKERSDIILRIDAYLEELIGKQKELIERNERILKERIGDVLKNDSDKDGIADYDEVNLYTTDPFRADTDGDGFTDGLEILSGYDPLNSKSEALINYDSPRDNGIIREDLFEIKTLASLSDESNNVSEKGMLVSGVGLPDSFVTLYVYSTPVIVTVRTESDGSWSYIFDKELDDGKHEIYVGITDNAGRVVAKSNPFPFIKTAQAFTPIDAPQEQVGMNNPAPSLLSENVLLLVGSIAVVALGLVLILLGIHVNTRPTLLVTS